MNLLKRKRKNTNTYNAEDYKYFVDPICVAECKEAGITIVRRDFRPFYDSEWAVITPHFSITITRDDDETAESLMETILALPVYTKEQLAALDRKDKIYYD